VERLRTLRHGNEERQLWKNKVNVVLEAAFGKKSDEYIKLNTLFPIIVGWADEEGEQRQYLDDLKRDEMGIKEILQKYEILGIEEKPSNIKFPKPGKRYQTREVENEHTGLAEKPIQIFNAMQFHNKVVEASRKLFKDGHYRDAIYRAFVEVNNFVKDKANSQLDGKRLMSTVFSLDNTVIKINSLRTQSDRDEQEGFMFLFMGAMEGIRNPKAHENIIQNDPYRTLEYLGLASLLMKIAEEGSL
jgi:uncharacterized protein (TIGR02391 family)